MDNILTEKDKTNETKRGTEITIAKNHKIQANDYTSNTSKALGNRNTVTICICILSNK